ncbi:hypothetical protein JW872_02940 [Candidatus Babeliales bacterium]|nr:hypothetical protein [Candidatus Babeliales bacterium]
MTSRRECFLQKLFLAEQAAEQGSENVTLFYRWHELVKSKAAGAEIKNSYNHKPKMRPCYFL